MRMNGTNKVLPRRNYSLNRLKITLNIVWSEFMLNLKRPMARNILSVELGF